MEIEGQPKKKIVPNVTYNRDGLATIHNCDFMQDPRFAEAYALGKATGSWGSADTHWRTYIVCWAAQRGQDTHWRTYIVCWAAQRGLAYEGDFIECGVNRGGYARAVIAYTQFAQLPRKFYLLDTYAGLVDEYISEEERAHGLQAGGYAECFDVVKKTFAPYANVVLVRGAIPETLPNIKSEKVAFLSIDMNCTPPEIAAANYLWDRLSSGAVVILDDYGWPGHIHQKQAFDKFALERKVQVLALPTGQGLIIKP